MLLLPKTPPSTYPKTKKINGPKMDHFSLFTFSLTRSTAGTAQHSTKPLLEEIPFNLRKNEKTEIALNFMKEIQLKISHLQCYMKNPSLHFHFITERRSR